MGPRRGFAVCDEFIKRLFRCSTLALDYFLHLGFANLSNHEGYLA